MSEQRTVKVRLIVGVDAYGAWAGAGAEHEEPTHKLLDEWNLADDLVLPDYYIIEAELPVPPKSRVRKWEGGREISFYGSAKGVDTTQSE